MFGALNRGHRLPVGLAVALGALAFAPVAGAQEETGSGTQTECAVVPIGFGEGVVFAEQCPTQGGSSTSTQLFTFVNDLRTRIIQQRRGKRILQAQEQQTAGAMTLGGAASADEDGVGGVSAFGRLSPFAIVDVADADRERTAGGQAYDQDTESVILGADYRVNDTLFVGGTLNYLNGDTEFANDAGSIDVDSYILGLHGSKYWGNSFFMDALVTYGQLDADIVRNVEIFGQRRRYTASPDGDELSAEVAVGYEYSEGRNRITPLAKLHYFDGSLDGYTEDGSPFPGPQTVGKQDFDAVNLQLGLQADTVLLMGWGVLIPSVNFSYYREFSDANTVEVSNGGLPALTQRPDNPDRHTYVIRLGASAQFTHGWSGFVSFEKLLHHDYLDRNNAVLGVRYEIF